MAVTIRDIAKMTKISVATVSRILGNYGYVSQEKREIVEKCAKKLHYMPNSIARSMIKKRTNTIGLLIADIHDPFYIGIVDLVEKLADDAGYSVLLCNSNNAEAKEAKNIKTLLERKIDGIVMVPVTDFPRENASSQRFEDLRRHSVPFVFIDLTRSDVDTDVVMLDNHNTASKAMSLLIGQGYQKIGVVFYSSGSNERVKGIKEACRKLKFTMVESDWINCELGKDNSSGIVKKAIEDNKFDALFTLENSLTIASLKAISELRLELNTDIYLLGFDDIRIFNQLIPENIGVIQQPVELLCKYALEMLIERIEGQYSGNGRTVSLEGKIQL